MASQKVLNYYTERNNPAFEILRCLLLLRMTEKGVALRITPPLSSP